MKLALQIYFDVGQSLVHEARSEKDKPVANSGQPLQTLRSRSHSDFFICGQKCTKSMKLDAVNGNEILSP